MIQKDNQEFQFNNRDQKSMQKCKGMEFSEYATKESLVQQGGYGIANKGPQHDESWLIFT